MKTNLNDKRKFNFLIIALYLNTFIKTITLILESLTLLFRPYKFLKFKLKWQKWWQGYKLRFPDKNPIWIHAGAFGEVKALLPLIRSLHQLYPQQPITVTIGHEECYQVDFRSLHPCLPSKPLHITDYFGFFIYRALKRNPPLVLISFTHVIEVDMLLASKLNQIPIIFFYEAFLRFRQSPQKMILGKTSLKYALNSIHTVIFTEEKKAAEICRLGVPKKNLRLFSNLKLVLQENPLSKPNKHKMWLAASTHKGEEEVILNAHEQIRQRVPSLRLVICPRDITRADHLKKMVQKYCRFKNEIHINGILGNMHEFYAAAHVVFVGATFVPVGGHNVLEPVSHQKPTIVGPHTKNINDLIVACSNPPYGIIQVQNAEELAQNVIELLSDEEKCLQTGAACLAAVQKKSQNVLQNYLDLICPVIDEAILRRGIVMPEARIEQD